MKPSRIQRKRTKGWKMPEGAVYVGRPTQWGNSFVVGQPFVRKKMQAGGGEISGVTVTPEDAVRFYRRFLPLELRIAARIHLRGKSLACWCPLVCTRCNGSGFGTKNICHRIYTPGNIKDGGASVIETIPERCAQCQGTGNQPCHADVLLELANEDD